MQKLRITCPLLTREQYYAYLVEVWEREKMTTFKNFLRWYNNKDVIPTLEAMQKMIDFYHNKGIDTLKLGCTVPNLANICLHKSTLAKCYPLLKLTRTCWRKLESIWSVVSLLLLHARCSGQDFYPQIAKCVQVHCWH